MKRFLLCITCLFALTFVSSRAAIIEVAPAGAWGVLGISGGAPAAGGEETLLDGVDGYVTEDGTSYQNYGASKVSLTSGSEITKYIIRVCDDEEGGDLVVSLWDNTCTTCNRSDDEPNTQITDSDKTVTISTFTAKCASMADETITLATSLASLPASTDSIYWVVDYSTTTWHRLRSYDYGISNEARCTSSDGSTWACDYTTAMPAEV